MPEQSVINTHRELRCKYPPCEFDMRDDPETLDAVVFYLDDLILRIEAGEVRHVSLSVHPAEGAA